jgi:hypothetical protein
VLLVIVFLIPARMHSLIVWCVYHLSSLFARLFHVFCHFFVRRLSLQDVTCSFVSLSLHFGHLLLCSLSMLLSFLFGGKHLCINFKFLFCQLSSCVGLHGGARSSRFFQVWCCPTFLFLPCIRVSLDSNMLVVAFVLLCWLPAVPVYTAWLLLSVRVSILCCSSVFSLHMWRPCPLRHSLLILLIVYARLVSCLGGPLRA